MHCNIFIPNQELHSIIETIHEVKKKITNISAVSGSVFELWWYGIYILLFNSLAEDPPPISK